MDSTCQLACILDVLAIGSLLQFSLSSRLVGYFCRAGLVWLAVKITIIPSYSPHQ